MIIIFAALHKALVHTGIMPHETPITPSQYHFDILRPLCGGLDGNIGYCSFFLACMQYLLNRRDNISVSPEFYFCIALYIANNTTNMYRQHYINLLVTISRPATGQSNSMLHFHCKEHNFQFNPAKLYSIAQNTTFNSMLRNSIHLRGRQLSNSRIQSHRHNSAQPFNSLAHKGPIRTDTVLSRTGCRV